MFHLVAYSTSFNAATETEISAIADGIMAVQNNHIIPQSDRYLIWAMGVGLNMQRLRLVSPTLRQVTTPFIRPIEELATPGNLFHFMRMSRVPLLLKGLEEISLFATQDSGGAERENGLLALSRGIVQPADNQQVFCMRGTSVTASVANAWTQIAVTWQDTLPVGKYECVGLECIGATELAARLIFEDQVDRPGCPGTSDEDTASWPAFQDGTFGVWGRFDSNRMPNVEVLNTAAVSAHTVFLYFRRAA